MARVELDRIADALHGRLSGDSDFYATNRYGRTIISNYPKHRNPKKITAHQRELNSAFAQTVKQCKLEMSNPERLAFWQERYVQYCKLANRNLAKANAQFFNIDPITTLPAKQKYYQTLRGFIIAQLLLPSTHSNE